MVGKKTQPGKAHGDSAQDGTDATAGLSPEAALSVWGSWLKSQLGAWPGQEIAAHILPPWLATPEAVTGDAMTAGLDPFRDFLDKDLVLSSIDRAWNANPMHEVIPVDWAEVVRALRTVWLRRLADPGRMLTAMAEMNAQTVKAAVNAWNDAATRWWGLASATSQSGRGADDKRFDAPEWHANPVYRTLKDLYLLASDFLLKESEAEDLEPAERERLRFHLEQFVNATSPTLLLFSNPAALRRAMETGGASIADGARNLLHDVQEGRLTMVDAKAFAPGRNLAVTPGKVVYRNRLIELIQYMPQTEQVYQTPLLFIPPWINKYYILDMQPKNSFVRYLVEQGFSVFVISWKNPDASMEEITFEDYMRDGPLAAADVAKEITGSSTVNPVGYCIGGTLLVLALAYLAARGQQQDPFGTATFLVSLQDFAQVGESSLFMGELSIDFIEQQMMERGYLDSREMSAMFSLLRSNDLIWANVVNNYLLGNPPPAFDLLYWNSDGTRMARAAHSWYLRNTYVENNLIKAGHVTILGEPIDLGRIEQDIYAVGAEKDHIVPWHAAWRITQLTGGRVRFVRASSGHIAGVINHPGPKKGAFWVNEEPATSSEAWLDAAAKHEGSWWTDWIAWLGERSGEKVKPPPVGSKKHPPLMDAPGSYVLEK